MKRNVIEIDETKCNGCGLCVNGCPEGAIRLIDGKARLVAENFCDGLGACIGECPLGAITTVEKEAQAYDERLTLANILPKGVNTLRAHLHHMYSHGEMRYLNEALDELKNKGIDIPEYISAETHTQCPHSKPYVPAQSAAGGADQSVHSERIALSNWPIQLKLLSVQAPYLQNSDIIFAADCTAFAYSAIHQEYLKNRVTIIFCPKLDQGTEEYIEKISMMLVHNRIRSIEVLRMEVPCCGGTTYIVNEAIARSKMNYSVKETIIRRDGTII